MEFVLITGASAGIGKELAREFAKNKRNLVLVARRADKLLTLADELKKSYAVQVFTFELDLAVHQSAEHLFRWIESQGITLDTLVNNAGIGMQGDFVNQDSSKVQSMIDLNISSLVQLSHKFLQHVGNRKSLLIQLASTAAFFPGPHMAAYYASKAFVLSFSQALREELKSTNCSISVVCPGPVLTEFQQVAKMDTDQLKKKAKFAMVSVEQVAQQIYNESKKGKFLIVPGLLTKISVFFSAITPVWLSNLLISRLHAD